MLKGAHNYEVHIFGGYYKLWRSDSSQYEGTWNAPGGSTAGFHNIGFTHARDVAAFIDGVDTGLEILWAAHPSKPKATFGSLAAGSEGASLKLLENLNYIRSFLQGECTGSGDPRKGGGGYPVGGPNPPDYPTDPCDTDQPVFDALQKSAVAELLMVPDGQEWTLETNLVVDYQGSPDRAERFHANGSYTDLYLVSTSRRTALVVRDGMDAMVQGEEGLEVDPALDPENPEEPGEPTFGVAYRVMHGAGGTPTYYARLSPDDTSHPDERDEDGADPTYDQECQPQGRNPGMSDDPSPVPEPITSYPVPTILEQVQTIQASGDEANLDGDENCACNGEDVSQAHNAVSSTDTSTGNQHDYNGGDQYDPHSGVQFNDAGGGYDYYGEQHFEKRGDSVFFKVGDTVYRLKDATKYGKDGKPDENGLYDARYENLILVSGDDVMAPPDDSFISNWVNQMAGFGGSGCASEEDKKRAMSIAESVFDVLGFVPLVGELADVAAASLATMQGDYVGAALSLISTIPLAGDLIAKPIKWAWKAGKNINWGKFYDVVQNALGPCVDAGLKGQIQKALKKVRDFLNGRGFNLPAGWCFVAGTPVATDEGDKPIEEVDVGDRVLTPETLNDGRTWTAVDQRTWRVVVLSLPNPDCEWDIIRLRLLRPRDWLARHGLPGASRIWLSVEELGIHGLAKVHAIEPCPPIRGGRGRVVTGTVNHFNGFVKQLWFAGSDVPLHPTDVHPFYSADRNEWVKARDLREGEAVATAASTATIERIGSVPGIHRVYNLEVEREHCYFVGWQQTLVHNACHEHHVFPKYLGGDKKGVLVTLDDTLHRELHSALNKWKGGKYSQWKGASAFEGMDKAEVINDLRDFYKSAEGGKFAFMLDAFEEAVAAAK